MTDRLPAPLADVRRAPLAERASATTARAVPRAPADYATTKVVENAATETLRGLQAWMIAAIAGPESAAESAGSVIRDGERMTARERLEIYRYGYTARLIDCVIDDYPVLTETLGHEGFHALGHVYVERYPSTSPSLNAFGRHMAELCKDADSLPEGFAAHAAFLSELAELEWAVVQAIHAAPSTDFDVAALQRIPSESLGDARLVAGASVNVLHFEYPTNAYYQRARMTDECPPLPEAKPTATAVYRRGTEVWRMDLTPAMARVLDALLESRSIGEALARMGVDETNPEELAEAERSVMVWFREWVEAGFFSGVSLPE